MTYINKWEKTIGFRQIRNHEVYVWHIVTQTAYVLPAVMYLLFDIETFARWATHVHI